MASRDHIRIDERSRCDILETLPGWIGTERKLLEAFADVMPGARPGLRSTSR